MYSKKTKRHILIMWLGLAAVAVIAPTFPIALLYGVIIYVFILILLWGEETIQFIFIREWTKAIVNVIVLVGCGMLLKHFILTITYANNDGSLVRTPTFSIAILLALSVGALYSAALLSLCREKESENTDHE